MTILAACSCTFSNFSISAEEQPSHTTEAYSNIGLIKVIYNFDSLSMPKVNLSFLSSPNFFTSVAHYIIDVHRPFQIIRER